jgi:hypothetical protein
MVDSVVGTQGFFGSMDPKELNDIFLNTNVYSQIERRLQKLDDNRVQNNYDLLRIEKVKIELMQQQIQEKNVQIEHMQKQIEAKNVKINHMKQHFTLVTTSLQDDINVLHTRMDEELKDVVVAAGNTRSDIQDMKQMTAGDFQRIRDRLVTTISFGTDFALYWHMNKTTNEVSLQKVPECIICMDKTRDIKITACKHVLCCRSCVTKLHQCPLCRGPSWTSIAEFELVDWKEELKDVPLNNTSVDDDKMIMSGIFKDTRTQFERLCI